MHQNNKQPSQHSEGRFEWAHRCGVLRDSLIQKKKEQIFAPYMKDPLIQIEHIMKGFADPKKKRKGFQRDAVLSPPAEVESQSVAVALPNTDAPLDPLVTSVLTLKKKWI